MLNYSLLCTSIGIISVILAACPPYVRFDVSVTRREPVPHAIVCSETCAGTSPHSTCRLAGLAIPSSATRMGAKIAASTSGFFLITAAVSSQITFGRRLVGPKWSFLIGRLSDFLFVPSCSISSALTAAPVTREQHAYQTREEKCPRTGLAVLGRAVVEDAHTPGQDGR